MSYVGLQPTVKQSKDKRWKFQLFISGLVMQNISARTPNPIQIEVSIYWTLFQVYRFLLFIAVRT